MSQKPFCDVNPDTNYSCVGPCMKVSRIGDFEALQSQAVSTFCTNFPSDKNGQWSCISDNKKVQGVCELNKNGYPTGMCKIP